MFSSQIHSFARTLDGLRSFVNMVEPFLNKKGRDAMKKHAGNMLPLFLAFAKADPEFLKDTGLTETKLKKLQKNYKGTIVIKQETVSDKPRISISVSGPQEKALDLALSEIGENQECIALLYQSSLISLISAVECFLSQIIHTYYDTVPESLSDKDKVFSFDDLKNFNSVEDARTYLIEKKVNDLMRKSFTDWISFFKDKTGLSMSYLTPYMDTLVETCERRNLLVHNAGIVNTIYLSKVSLSLRKGKKKDDRLHLSRQYLDDRIDYFEKYSLLIAAELWKKLKPKVNKRAELLSDIAYKHLRSARWSVAEGLSYFMKMDKSTKETYQLIGTLNYWQCLKKQDRWAEVKEESERADFSAKGIRFQLGHLALLENKPKFFEQVPIALKSKEITIEELREFPILEEVRKDRRFSPYRLKRKSATKISANVSKSKTKRNNTNK